MLQNIILNGAQEKCTDLQTGKPLFQRHRRDFYDKTEVSLSQCGDQIRVLHGYGLPPALPLLLPAPRLRPVNLSV